MLHFRVRSLRLRLLTVRAAWKMVWSMQALEVARQVQRAHMHLHGAAESDESDADCDSANERAEVSTAVPGVSAEARFDGAHPASLDATSHTPAHDSYTVSLQHDHSHDMGLPGGVEFRKNDSLEACKATVMCENWKQSAVFRAKHTEKGDDCMETCPQVSSQSPASVQHFLAHMEV
jgi:hypothetical protein